MKHNTLEVAHPAIVAVGGESCATNVAILNSFLKRETSVPLMGVRELLDSPKPAKRIIQAHSQDT